MSTKRQPSKQRRQTQNQKQRAALEARRAAAAAGKAPAGKVGGAASSSKGGSVLSRFRSAGPSSSSSAPASSSSSSGGGSALSRLRGASATGRSLRTSRSGGELPVGHRAAMSALFAAIAAAVVGSMLFKVPVDRGGEAIVTRGALVAEWVHTAADAVANDPEATPDEIADSIDDWLPSDSKPYLQAFWPISAGVLLPVLGTALGFRAVSRRSPAKVVNRTMYVTLFGSLLASQLLLIFLPAVISLAVAAFQVRKAEVTANREAVSDDDAGDDEVIEVDEIDEVDELEDAEDVDDAVEVDEVGDTDVTAEAEDKAT